MGIQTRPLIFNVIALIMTQLRKSGQIDEDQSKLIRIIISVIALIMTLLSECHCTYHGITIHILVNVIALIMTLLSACHCTYHDITSLIISIKKSNPEPQLNATRNTDRFDDEGLDGACQNGPSVAIQNDNGQIVSARIAEAPTSGSLELQTSTSLPHRTSRTDCSMVIQMK